MANDKAYFNKRDYESDIRAIDARFEAQKIAFSPLTFFAVDSMISLGVLKAIEEASDAGLTSKDVSKICRISLYAAGLLCDVGLVMGILRLKALPNTGDVENGEKGSAFSGGEVTNDSDAHYVLGKTGFMMINDALTQANFSFVRDVCYDGAKFLKESFINGAPEGLKVFGDKWATVYEALSSLPNNVQKSWFDFDHYYSDVAFPEALPIVFAQKPKNICDIGGNTAKWAIACCKYNSDVTITIVDLPGQTKMAQKAISDAGYSSRIDTFCANVLSDDIALPARRDVYWMSQFLDCFSLEQVTKIIQKIGAVCDKGSSIFVLEPLWDEQKFAGNAYSLVATSLYFSCIANGCSKMYKYSELVGAIEAGGVTLKTAHHNLGRNSYTLLEFKR